MIALIAALALATPRKAPAPAPPPAAAPAACTGAEHHQFDFWVGDWTVVDAKTGAPAGTSRVERLYGGCVLRENWSEPGFTGGSLNIYTAPDGHWHQTWTDQSGALRQFTGGLVSGKMVLIAEMKPPFVARPRLVRMTFAPRPDGSVEQASDYSQDAGATWIERYDYIYRPAKGRG